MSRFDLTLEPERVARRIEVINGAGGRRRWSADDKARILEETLAPGAVVSEIARRHGLRPQQVFGWRREARIAPDEDGGECLAFVPAVVEALRQSLSQPPRFRNDRRSAAAAQHLEQMQGSSSRSMASRCGSERARRRRRLRR